MSSWTKPVVKTTVTWPPCLVTPSQTIDRHHLQERRSKLHLVLIQREKKMGVIMSVPSPTHKCGLFVFSYGLNFRRILGHN
ncbi:hypothetical protein CDAR_204721 [Caerostris darwini]|uniref:Uncharacterized protein n=1 Tax=Caerostris darwini TaxID=1538125 RepID=A0AAV4UXE9_9ARAC|nr:hypothetical protein CDAR_204721 [Caerostris darwini]